MSEVIYFDNNATTKVAPEVVEVMLPFFTEFYGNPSSMHTFGGDVGSHVKKARASVAKLFNCSPAEIVFMGSGSEGNNYAIRGTIEAHPDRRRIVTTRVEHPAVLATCQGFARRGYHVSLVGCDSRGRLDPKRFEEEITEDTAIVSVMYANNEIGNVYPIEEIGAICREKGVVFHVDAVQAAGKIPIDVQKLPVDLMTISGHKLHAPKGIGAAYVRKGTRVRPLVTGGHQEAGRRAGTENVPYIVGFGRACELALENMVYENTHVSELRDLLEKGLLANIPVAAVNGDVEHRLPGTTNISFEYIEGEAILLHMNEHNICASSGSACSSGSLEPSHVLRAMGVPFTRVHGSIRFSLSRYNTLAEVEKTLKVFPQIVNNLSRLSPYSANRKPAGI